MNPDGLGPPEKERPSGYQAARPDQKLADTTTNRLHDYAPARQCRCNTVGRWRYADPWQHVFRRGALDALRCAARESDDPDVWAVLDRIADRYDDPDDDYGLAR